MIKKNIWVALFLILALLCAPATSFSAKNIPNDDSVRTRQIVSPHDVLEVRIYPQKDLNRDEIYVDENGFIFFDFLGNIKVGGLTVGETENKLREMLEKDYLKEPNVVVRVKKSAKSVIVIIGEVKGPGTYDYTPGGMTLMEAISKANGFTNIAWLNKTKVVRVQDGKEMSYQVKVGDIIDGKQKDVMLLPGDIIVVPETIF